MQNNLLNQWLELSDNKIERALFFANALNDAINTERYTKRQLAGTFEVSLSTLSRWATNKSIPHKIVQQHVMEWLTKMALGKDAPIPTCQEYLRNYTEKFNVDNYIEEEVWKKMRVYPKKTTWIMDTTTYCNKRLLSKEQFNAVILRLENLGYNVYDAIHNPGRHHRFTLSLV